MVVSKSDKLRLDKLAAAVTVYQSELDRIRRPPPEQTPSQIAKGKGPADKNSRSLTDLPVELLENILAKCAEVDYDNLEAETEILAKKPTAGSVRVGASTSTADNEDAEAGWETDDEDMLPPRPDRDTGTCRHCGEVHGSESEDEDSDEPDGKCMDKEGPDEKIYDEEATFEGERDKILARLPKPATPILLQMSATCKTLRQLALPLIWSKLDGENLPNKKLEVYLSEIIPKYGHLVKQLWIRIALNENREFTEITFAEGEDPEIYHSPTRHNIVLEILRAMPNLTSLDIDVPTTNDFDPPPIADLIDDIVTRGDKLTSLFLTSDEQITRLAPARLCAILQKLPKLVNLELDGVDTDNFEGEGPHLRDVIASLEHLSFLELGDALCVDDTWAEMEFKGSIKTISLDDCQNISGSGLEKWLVRNSNTLEAISLVMVPYDEDVGLNLGLPFSFPKLKDLNLESYHLDLGFLQRFSQCPRLERIQLGDMDNIDVKQLSQLIEISRTPNIATSDTASTPSAASASGFPALKKICLSSDWTYSTSPSHMESFELVCFSNGITLHQEEPDSDDEEDDDEYDTDELDESDIDPDEPWTSAGSDDDDDDMDDGEPWSEGLDDVD